MMLIHKLLRNPGSCKAVRCGVRSISVGLRLQDDGTPSATTTTTTLTIQTDSSSSARKMPYLDPYTTSVTNPAEHCEDHLGLWYTINPEEFQRVFTNKFSLSLYYYQLADTFNEMSFMIRRPSLSVISYIKQLKLHTITPPKFLFYGAEGVGKTCCLAHVIYYLSREGFVMVMVPWINRWLKQYLKHPNEVVPSNTVPDLWDHTTDAADWLKFFRHQNLATLEKMDLPISRDYQFSTREHCLAGTPVLGIVDLGILRPKLAAECVVALLTELRMLATDGRCKVAVVLDGVNALFTEDSIYRKNEIDFFTKKTWSYLPARSFTLVQALIDMFNNDWSNGVIVGSVDYRVRKDRDKSSYFPRYVLGEEGFEKLDPFVPVPVPEYSPMEFDSAVAYYASKHWIQKPEALTPEGKKQLAAVSGRNAFYLMRTCGPI